MICAASLLLAAGAAGFSLGAAPSLSLRAAQQPARTVAPRAVVLEISSQEEFDKALGSAGDSLVVIDYSTSWCGPCKIIAPKFDEFSEQYKNVAFLKVMGDSSPEADKLMRSQVCSRSQLHPRPVHPPRATAVAPTLVIPDRNTVWVRVRVLGSLPSVSRGPVLIRASRRTLSSPSRSRSLSASAPRPRPPPPPSHSAPPCSFPPGRAGLALLPLLDRQQAGGLEG